MLGLSILYVEAELSDNLDELFYGLKAAVVAIVARALVGSADVHHRRSPGAVGGRAFALTIFADPGFVLVLLGAGLLYELWTSARSWVGRSHSLSLSFPALLIVLAGTVTFSLTAEIFWEGLKAGLVTFGGAFTAIPYLQDARRRGERLADRSTVRRRPGDRRRSAGSVDHLLDLRRLHRRRAGRRPSDDGRDLHPGLRLPDLLSPPTGGARRERALAAVPARRSGGRDRSDRRRHGRHRRRRAWSMWRRRCSPSAAFSSSTAGTAS